MRWMGYAWTVAVNCLNVFVVLVVFAKLFPQPEAIIVAVLGLMYGTMATGNALLGLGLSQSFVTLTKQVLEVRRLLKDPQFGTTADELWAAEKTLNDRTPKTYITVFFLSLISLICLCVLAVKILGS